MALSPRQDGGAHDRDQDRLGRLEWRRILAKHPVHSALPRPLGHPGEAVTIREAASLYASPNPLAAHYSRFQGGRAAAADGSFAPGLARPRRARAAARLGRRRTVRGRQVGARVRAGGSCARRLRTALGCAGFVDQPRNQYPRADREVALGAAAARAAVPRDHRRRVPQRAAAPATTRTRGRAGRARAGATGAERRRTARRGDR